MVGMTMSSSSLSNEDAMGEEKRGREAGIQKWGDGDVKELGIGSGIITGRLREAVELGRSEWLKVAIKAESEVSEFQR